MSPQICAKKKKNELQNFCFKMLMSHLLKMLISAEDAQGTLPAASIARTAEFCGSMSLLGTRASDTQVTSLNSHQQLP